MLKIILPNSIINQLTSALHQAGKQEIGGILMGEHIGENTFQIKSVTIQMNKGTIFTFKRMIQNIMIPLRHFFHKTNHQYTKFNYLGEWHSHPSFSLEPSLTDSKTMWDLVEDPQVGANFAILLIIRLVNANLQGTVTIYLPNHQYMNGQLIMENNDL